MNVPGAQVQLYLGTIGHEMAVGKPVTIDSWGTYSFKVASGCFSANSVNSIIIRATNINVGYGNNPPSFSLSAIKLSRIVWVF
jgi:hypothetical protein